MSAMGPKSRDLFRQARADLSPPSASRDRVRARLASKLGAAAIGVAVSTTTAKASGAAGSASTLGTVAAKGGALAIAAKIATPLIVIPLIVMGAVKVGQVAPSRSQGPTTLSSTSAAPIAATALPVTSSATPVIVDIPIETVNEVNDTSAAKTNPTSTAIAAPTRPVQSAIVQPTPPVVQVDRGLSEEVALVDQIERSLRDGDSQSAARLTKEHEKRFPQGALVEEREGAGVLARCLSGAGATSGANAFLAAHPKSPMRTRISAACFKPTKKEE